ncbi:MAG TPA: hypothetical protein VGN01_02975 [Acidobacteriaceae bacterium]
MKKLLTLCVAMVMMFTTASAFAATDFSGTWAGDMKGPDGSAGFHLSFTFKVAGDKLTGSVQGPQGEPIAITDGKVEGDKISFHVPVNGMVIVHEGTMTGDTIKLTSKSDMPGSGDLILTRVAAAKAP